MKLSNLGSSCGVAAILLVAPALLSLPPVVNAHSLPTMTPAAVSESWTTRGVEAGMLAGDSAETVHRLVIQVVEEP